jgi:hypothetical protein
MAGLKDFKKVAGGPEVSKLQERLQEFFAQFATNPLLDGVLLTGIELSTTTTAVAHKLQRKPLGWLVVDIDEQETIARDGAATVASLPLVASGPCVVSLWVF